MVKKEIAERVEKEAEFLIKTKGTVRYVAPFFGVSKSTVHNDLTKILAKINNELYIKVQKILEKNLNERHIRGGQATKIKYMRGYKSMK